MYTQVMYFPIIDSTDYHQLFMVNQLVINLMQVLIMYLCCLISNTAALLYFTAVY